jgi:hypothetical protein
MEAYANWLLDEGASEPCRPGRPRSGLSTAGDSEPRSGYIGDLCRMAIQGEPDSELEDLLGEVDAIQMAARKPIRPGVNGGEIYASAGEVLKKLVARQFD